MSRVRHLHLALGLALLASSIGLASQAATSPSIDGVVVGAGANGQPIAGATVVLASGSRTLSTATTDSDGRFTFRDLTAPCSCT
ncbi:MAG: carboxypeptidase-like regulatory domain-containing protein, partial [Actinomycetes bacterium]